MSASHSSTVIATIVAYLRGMKHVLGQAQAYVEAKEIEESALLGARMIADMAPLSFQVQTASELPARGIARLAGASVPDYGRDEKTLADFVARLDRATADVAQHSVEDVAAGLERDHEVPLGPTAVPMNGALYLYQFLLPNFFFHATTTYSILRENGVPLGKRDFMAGAQFMPGN
ncbi:MAG: DUF1993 domain-containing protein [Pseudomonadota bacterium]